MQRKASLGEMTNDRTMNLQDAYEIEKRVKCSAELHQCYNVQMCKREKATPYEQSSVKESIMKCTVLGWVTQHCSFSPGKIFCIYQNDCFSVLPANQFINIWNVVPTWLVLGLLEWHWCMLIYVMWKPNYLEKWWESSKVIFLTWNTHTNFVGDWCTGISSNNFLGKSWCSRLECIINLQARHISSAATGTHQRSFWLSFVILGANIPSQPND